MLGCLFYILAEADLQKLRHALKILSDSEKQFRTSKNQTTWLTVALLQLSSVDSDSLDANDSRVWQRNGRDAENRRFSASSTAGSPNNSLSCMYNNHRSQNSKNHGDAKGNLEQIWKDALEKCQSSTFRSFLLNEGKLSSVFFNEGLAVAEVEFCRPDDVSRAEKSWKLIASLLQLVLGCNVEIRINLVHCNFFRKNGKVKKPSFSLLSCSRRMPSTVEDGNDESGKSDFTSSPTIIRENPEESCSSNHGSHFSPAIRNDEANIHTNGTATPHRSIQDDQTHGLRVGVKVNGESQLLASQEPEYQPGCFSKTTRSERKFRSLDASCTICLKVQPHNKLDLPEDPYFCASDPYIVCSSSNTFSSNSNGDEDWVRKELGMNSKMRCWRTPKLTLKRVLKCLASETAE
ncbi:hypothetical protein GIB67_027788 [Kingdonia uniflora]|uniref:STICHEL DnaA-N-like alpha-beta domain-containing protein n=1 Tax=Kingdonia uniflora TaxID=39325 RepID=A0A7J7PCW2_9MAGN|nr:hypothetical protein GIB67_027788 [Kingdonia uniflora]